MKPFQTAIFLAFIILVNSAFATEKKNPIDAELDENPIDAELDACLAKPKNMTTAGMTNCTYAAAEAWDKELNRVYKLLMSKLGPTGKENLKGAQVAWIKFRDSEYKNIDSIYEKLQGSMYIPMRVMDRLSVTKNRALELQGYLWYLICSDGRSTEC